MNKLLPAYDIVISGGGPAGTSAALALRESGLSVLLIDKDEFPRDKVCGDALGGKIPKILNSISPDLKTKFLAFSHKTNITGCRLFAPNLKHVDVHFSTPGYTSKRKDFDHFLFEEMKAKSGAHVLAGEKIIGLERLEDNIRVETQEGKIFNCKIILGCDGAQSIVAKFLLNQKLEPEHNCGAVRAYYENVKEVDPGMLEVYFLKGFMPGYFWIFPLEEGKVNVGFGMLTSTISSRKINLKQSIPEIISTFPILKKRFSEAKLIGDIRGFGLPLGSKQRVISDAHVMLCGDAAGLIDPFTGEGIGNAMFSGLEAAKLAEQCFIENDFSAKRLQAYDQVVFETLGSTFKTSYLLQKILNKHSWLIKVLILSAGRSKFVRNWLHKAM